MSAQSNFVLDYDQAKSTLHYFYTELDMASYITGHLRSRDVFLEQMGETHALNTAAFSGSWRDLGSNFLQFAPLDETEERHSEHGFNSKVFVHEFICKSLKSGKLSDGINTIYQLQRKFELFKRLFDKYDSGIRKIGDNYSDVGLYAVFSIAMSVTYFLDGDFNCLNTALKANDLLVSQSWKPDTQNAQLMMYALQFEKLAIDSLHE